MIHIGYPMKYQIYNIGQDVNCYYKKTLKNCIVLEYYTGGYKLKDIKTNEIFKVKAKDVLPGHFYIFKPSPTTGEWAPPEIHYTMKQISF